MMTATDTGPGKDPSTDLVVLEIGPQADIGCIALILGIIRKMKLERLPGRMTMKKGTMTLAMEATIEGAARRP